MEDEEEEREPCLVYSIVEKTSKRREKDEA
uniref:Uncharacterized protein n=1 Tax=Nelumbo nucifera TaxID=4432 RepID=A0A822XSU5_NELNU|nr:TPA_asm: hypothetical protein HUJ06_026148 [Nelumbo nucifera]